MRQISEDLAAHLGGDATTLCHCWRLTRRDGVVLGFTEHDRNLAFDGTDFKAASGFRRSETEAEDGLAAPPSEVTGGFSSEAMTEGDLASGRYDGARVEVFIVNWQALDQRLLLKVQEIGEVSRGGGQFTAELRSFAHRLGQENGRVYNRRCDADLGDGRCRVNLAAFRATGTVTAVEAPEQIVASGLDGFSAGFFDGGRLVFESGANAGLVLAIDSTRAVDGGIELRFWLPLEVLPESGDTFEITAGCDKSFSTCRARFSNHLNFQGFPHVPGSDFAYSYADGSGNHDGGALFE
ncbi:DUF2163 domain-containing protein [Agrobacterium sp. ES01]|uniref:DUF2163 domain-containing protein n=1 Tax=Agrobacterium sp. ES01 TaxID=3420714 RepID=UPI003D10B844